MSSCLGVGNAVMLAWARGRRQHLVEKTAPQGRRICPPTRRESAALRAEVALHRRAKMTAAAREGGPAPAPVPAQVKLLTLVIIEQDGRLLLGMKKRGFGEGYYNGFGGKVEAGETVEQAAARELEEEAGVIAVSMVKRGVLTFHFDDKPVPWEVHVFHVEEFVGEPCETEEMSPIWFSITDIPYDKMWKDDVIWYPPFLKGLSFRGDFFFKNTHELVSHSLQIVPIL